MKAQKIGNWRDNIISKAEGAGDAKLLVTVKVNEKEYVPANLKLRSRINGYLFTAEAKGKDLIDAVNDLNVVSLEVSKPMQMID